MKYERSTYRASRPSCVPATVGARQRLPLLPCRPCRWCWIMCVDRSCVDMPVNEQIVQTSAGEPAASDPRRGHFWRALWVNSRERLSNTSTTMWLCSSSTGPTMNPIMCSTSPTTVCVAARGCEPNPLVISKDISTRPGQGIVSQATPSQQVPSFTGERK